ncbi:membrane protein [Yersinia similis]|uniref:Membrane protein n=1 Tax=Yersinia similis TaxID=367190 RepID=A0ABN4CHW4_9GAMM|nr:TIGR03747 family integrating conjugative element membrane protein [Yersinia similis]AHK18432.1 membrane protein [Yersinia similis]CNC60977.1 putative inner membrane protein [Yersinia similis]
MTQLSSSTPQTPPHRPLRRPGFLTTILWDIPWQIVGMLLVSLLLSLIVEYIGIAFFWSEQGAEHSRVVMITESRYFSEGFTRSLSSSAPVTSANIGITQGYQWLFVQSGFMGWVQSVHQENSHNGVVDGLNAGGVWLMQVCREYLMATLYVTQVFLMRVTILMLSIPLFVLTALVGGVDGIVRRDLRRYGAGYESSFLYHHAKRLVKPALFIPCVLYLSAPFSVYPNTILLPAALLMGLAISVTMGSFKKYL